ncbi:hypothetical protein F4777DRAFT_580685 [Nemania sp. FL0916]|nr:hypothetical protein F4777DRAFT_580685 [Nemania sp. FL0916]
MSTNSNSNLAEQGSERAEPELNYSNSTRIVRDITYKIIPSCAAFLVVFSVGGALESTFADNKPLPRQATLVISIFLLALTFVFFVGCIYLRYSPRARIRFGTSTPPNSKRGSKYGLWANVKNFVRILKRFSSQSGSYTGHSRTSSGQIIVDILRDPALSPVTFERRNAEPDSPERSQNMGQGRTEPTQGQGHYMAEQYEQPYYSSNNERPPDSLRPGNPNLNQFTRRRHDDVSIPPATAQPPRQYHAYRPHENIPSQQTRFVSQSGRQQPRSTPLERNIPHPSGPRDYNPRSERVQPYPETPQDVGRPRVSNQDFDNYPEAPSRPLPYLPRRPQESYSLRPLRRQTEQTPRPQPWVEGDDRRHLGRPPPAPDPGPDSYPYSPEDVPRGLRRRSEEND